MSCICRDHGVYICNEDTVSQIRRHAQLLTMFLRETAFLTEAYILDYFVEELWNKFPTEWFEIVSTFDIQDLEIFLSQRNIRYKQVWPLSLLAFRASAFALPLPRKSIDSLKIIQNIFGQNVSPVNRNSQSFLHSETLQWCNLSNEFKSKSGQHKDIPEFCRRHVKPKKQHEIYRMAQVANVVLNNSSIKHIVDIGSGQGHLSRLLALCHNYKVATIEANQHHVIGAVNFDNQALLTIQNNHKTANNIVQQSCEETFKDFDDSLSILPHHLNGSMTLSTSQSCFQKIVKHAWEKDATNKDMDSIALLGLHTCGNLAETMLKTYVQIPQSKALLSIGCCYMKSECNGDCEGYPLSNLVKCLDFHKLSYEAKEIACHALEMYIQRIHGNFSSLKIHCYRATLEKCIVHHYPHLKHLGLRGVKHADQLEFSEYAQRALKKVSISIPKEYFTLPEIQSCLDQWKDVLIFYSLRLLTAPIVESLILIDRLLYLFEKGYSGCLVPIFDPLISPRNQILISVKDRTILCKKMA